jgi:hypothetical protein
MKQVVWLLLSPLPDGSVRTSFVGARINVPAPRAPAAKVRASKDAPWSRVAPHLLEAARGPTPAAVRLEVGGN